MLLLAVLFLVALIAGLVDSIAGGGGLITIPVLFGILPPQDVLGTNKLQATFGSGSAMFTFHRSGTVSLTECRIGILWTGIGAALGTVAVQRLDPALLRQLIPWFLAAIALYMLMSPRLGLNDVHPRMARGRFYVVAGLGLGFYDGFFGPGTGSFWAVALMLGLGQNLTTATGYTKVMNFTSNVASLALFAAGGHVQWREGLVMGIGQLVGARIGSRLAVMRGARFIRPIFIAMAMAIMARLIWQNLH
jgi:uncharacterized membrane protein YfcA